MSAAVETASTTSADKRAFENLLERALAPLMPVAIRYGMSAIDLSKAIRLVFLHEMEKRLTEERGHEISDARLALVTGLTRSEVALARARAAGKAAPGKESAELLSRVGKVLSAWHSNHKFCGAYGIPLDLELDPRPEHRDRSFQALIDAACAEMPKPVTLDELIANGVAETVGGTLVRCRARVAISGSSVNAGKAGLVAQYARFLALASGMVAHNILRDEDTDGHFDRLVLSDVPLSDSMRKRFATRAMASSDKLLHEIDEWLTKSAGEPNEGSDRHYGLGVFFFEERHAQDTASNQGGTLQSGAV